MPATLFIRFHLSGQSYFHPLMSFRCCRFSSSGCWNMRRGCWGVPVTTCRILATPRANILITHQLITRLSLSLSRSLSLSSRLFELNTGPGVYPGSSSVMGPFWRQSACHILHHSLSICDDEATHSPGTSICLTHREKKKRGKKKHGIGFGQSAPEDSVNVKIIGFLGKWEEGVKSGQGSRFDFIRRQN